MPTIFTKSPSDRQATRIEVGPASTYGDIISVLKTKHRYIDPRLEFHGTPLDPAAQVNPDVGTERRNPITVIGKQAPKGGLLRPPDIYAWVRQAVPEWNSNRDFLLKFSLPSNSTIENLLSQVFLDPVLGELQQHDRRLIFDGSFMESTVPLVAFSTTETNPLYCCFSADVKPGAKPTGQKRGSSAPPPRFAVNAPDETIVHFASFMLDPNRTMKLALPLGSKVERILTCLGGTPGVLFREETVFRLTSELRNNTGTEQNPVVACILPHSAWAWSPPAFDELPFSAQPPPGFVDLAFRLPGHRQLISCVFQTVGVFWWPSRTWRRQRVPESKGWC
jgi:hypothetical protein